MGFHTREVIENYIAAVNKSPENSSSTALAVEIDRYRRGNAPAGLLLDRPRFLGRFRCAEPRLPSSSAAMVGDNGALGLGMNILHLPRLLPTQTWRGSFGPDGGGPTLARERQPCPHRANQIRHFLRATSEHLKGPTFETAATSSHSCPLAE